MADAKIFLKVKLSGGTSNADPLASLGGQMSTVLVDDPSEFFDEVDLNESNLGDTEVRCYYLENTHGADSFVDIVAWIIQALLPGGGDAPEELNIVFDPVGVGDGVNTGVASVVSTEDELPSIKVPSNLSTLATTGGSLTSGTYYYVVTAINSNGETIASAEVSDTVDGAATTAIQISFDAVPGATDYRVYGRATGAQDTYWSTSNSTVFTDTGGAGTAGTPPVSNTANLVFPVTPPESEVDAVAEGLRSLDPGEAVPFWVKRKVGPNVTKGYRSKPKIRVRVGSGEG